MDIDSAPKYQDTVQAIWRLEKVILDTLHLEDVVQKTVDTAFSELGFLKLGYKIMVLSLVDEEKKVLRRIAISQTEEAKKAISESPVPFKEIAIPLAADSNICVQVLKQNKEKSTHKWADVLSPPLEAKLVNAIQKKVGIKSSVVYPVNVKGKTIGVMIFSLSKELSKISSVEKDFISSFPDIVGLAINTSQLYSKLEDTTEKLKKANVRLKSLDKLKDEFVSIASHELRTPMTAVKSYIWMALNRGDGDLDPKVKEYLTIANTSTERLIKLVGDMLTISRIEGKRLQLTSAPFFLQDLLKRVYDELSIKAKEQKIKFEIQAPKQKIKIVGDIDKLHEVVQNLVGNALKFTPANGTIIINAKKIVNEIEVSVSDTGPGMSRDDLTKLFQKFGMLGRSYEHTAPNVSGTGLGLYITKQIVMMHKGRIWVRSALGKGSTFFFTLPLK